MGWRVDCLGDMGGFSPTWSHMLDYYPQNIIYFGMQDAWKKAPVTLEVCWVMQHWKNKGWDVDYIIDQSLKWHISSFNAKSSAVPDEWWPQVNRWLKRMGYRFVLRKFTYPATVQPGRRAVVHLLVGEQGRRALLPRVPAGAAPQERFRRPPILSDRRGHHDLAPGRQPV